MKAHPAGHLFTSTFEPPNMALCLGSQEGAQPQGAKALGRVPTTSTRRSVLPFGLVFRGAVQPFSGYRWRRYDMSIGRLVPWSSIRTELQQGKRAREREKAWEGARGLGGGPRKGVALKRGCVMRPKSQSAGERGLSNRWLYPIPLFLT